MSDETIDGEWKGHSIPNPEDRHLHEPSLKCPCTPLRAKRVDDDTEVIIHWWMGQRL